MAKHAYVYHRRFVTPLFMDRIEWAIHARVERICVVGALVIILLVGRSVKTQPNGAKTFPFCFGWVRVGDKTENRFVGLNFSENVVIVIERDTDERTYNLTRSATLLGHFFLAPTINNNERVAFIVFCKHRTRFFNNITTL